MGVGALGCACYNKGEIYSEIEVRSTYIAKYRIELVNLITEAKESVMFSGYLRPYILQGQHSFHVL